MKKLVTIIVPTIGRPQYIGATIESILRQDYEEIEILISDNVPDTPTRLILGNNMDSRIRVVERDRRYGFSEHMNLCIDDARGQYLMILSDDDLISPSYVSSLVELFSENRNVIVGLGQQEVLNETNVSLSENVITRSLRTIDGMEYCLSHFQGKQMFPIYTYLSLFARKADVVAAGRFKLYPDGSHADNYLFYSLALKGKIGLSSGLMGYRVYSTSFGLSTPFRKLYQASLEYDKDMSKLLWSLESQPFSKRLKLRLLAKKSVVWMLKYRLFNLYKARLGLFSSIVELCRVILWFLPANIFFGLGRR